METADEREKEIKGKETEAPEIQGAKFEKDLTKGSVLKQMILFSLPFLLSNLIQAFYNVGDMLTIGLFNGQPSASAAINQGGQITLFVTNLIVGFCVGGTVIIAQYIGQKRYRDVKETIGTLFTFLAVAAAVLTVLVIFLAPAIVKLMGVAEKAEKDTIAYVRICMAGNIFVFGYNGISAVLRGMGDSVRPLIIVGCTCALNIGLDLIFLGVLHMGPAGSALTTVIAQAAAMLAAVLYLYKKKFIFDFKFKSFKINKDKLGKLVKVGLPTSLQNAVNSLSFIFLLAFVNSHEIPGAEAVYGAGAGIASKINGLAILPIFAVGMAVTAMSAQNISVSLYRRAYKTMFIGMGLCLIIGVTLYILTQFFAPQFIRLGFLMERPEYDQARAIELGAEYLRAFSLDYIAVAVFVSFAGLINGSGHTGISMIFSMCSAVLIRVPLAYILDRVAGLGFKGIAMSVPIATAVTTVLSLIYLLTGKWKRNKLGIDVNAILELS